MDTDCLCCVGRGKETTEQPPWKMEAGGQSQAAAARAALESQAKKANASAEEKADETMTARERAMQNLAKTGAVSKREAAGLKGESQMSAAMKNLAILYQRAGFKHKAVEMWERSLGAATDEGTRQGIKEHLMSLL